MPTVRRIIVGVHGSPGSLQALRFAADEPGVWTYTVKVRDKNGEISSPGKSFTVVTSPFHGTLAVAPNRRYLQYRDGTPFYGVGLWYNDGYSGFDAGRVRPEELDRLKLVKCQLHKLLFLSKL